MHLSIDYRKCRRAHQCCYLHPELFKADAGGVPVVLNDNPDEASRNAAEDAVELCPNGAIAITEET